MFTVYVLRSLKDGQMYVGITANLSARLENHQGGGVPSTKHRRPLELIHAELYETRDEARKREKFLKSGPGHQTLKLILGARRVPTSSG